MDFIFGSYSDRYFFNLFDYFKNSPLSCPLFVCHSDSYRLSLCISRFYGLLNKYRG